MLTPTNYFQWSMLMQINMEANLMWDAVEGNPSSVPNDKAALAAILRSIPPEMVGAIVVKKTAKEAWDTIKTMHMGVARVREATTQWLRSEFEAIAFRDGETLDAFGMRITSLVNNLRSLGDSMEEVSVVQKFLRVVPPRYMQIALAIETMLDLNTLSVEELVGRLSSAEERYLTNDQGGGAVARAQESARPRAGRQPERRPRRPRRTRRVRWTRRRLKSSPRQATSRRRPRRWRKRRP